MNFKDAHKFSTVQIDLVDAIAKKIKKFGEKIPDELLAEDGREDNPHITIKYGLHTEDAGDVEGLLENQSPFTVTFGKVSIFNASGDNDFDVVKVGVESSALRNLNKLLSDNLEHTTTHPTYKPHATIAYVKAGEGKRYIGNDFLDGQSFNCESITFRSKSGEATDIQLLKASKSMEYKYIPLNQFKMADDGAGTLEGYSNVANELDDGADIVIGYDDIEGFLASGFNAKSHDWTWDGLIGFPVDAKADEKGFWSKMQFHSTPDAQIVRTKAKERMEAGKQVGLSIGYAPSGDVKFIYPSGYETELPKYVKADRLATNLAKAKSFPRVRVLRVSVKEFSIVTSPMNKLSAAAAVKSMNEETKGIFADAVAQSDASDRLWRLTSVLNQSAQHLLEQQSDGELKDSDAAIEEMLAEFTTAYGGALKQAIKKGSKKEAGAKIEIKGAFEAELAERNNNPWAYGDIWMRILWQLIRASEASNGLATLDSLLAQFDEGAMEYLARMRAWFLAQVNDDEGADTSDSLMMAGLFEPEGAKSTLAAELEKTLVFLDSCATRTKFIQVERMKEGRMIGAPNRERIKIGIEKIKTAMEHMQKVHDDLKGLIDASEKPVEGDAEKANNAFDPNQALLRFMKVKHEATMLANQ